MLEDKVLTETNKQTQQETAKTTDYVSAFRAEDGPSEEVIRELSKTKDEPEWMLDFRLNALDKFLQKPMPNFGPSLDEINFDNISYYVKPIEEDENSKRTWDDVPDEMKETYDRLGVPRAEAEMLAGVSNQWDSEVVFHQLQDDLAAQGVIFTDMDTGLKEHEELVRKYFATAIPSADNKFAALNSAFWSGGSMVFVPKGVVVDRPLQTYFRINSKAMLQAERTLIIADEGAKVSYLEGCHPAGELISIGDRMVNVESLKPGDNIVNQYGNFNKVNKVMTREFTGDMITIKPVSPENRFQLTAEHPVQIISRSKITAGAPFKPDWLPKVDNKKLIPENAEFVPANEVSKGDFLLFPKIKPPVNAQLEEQFSDELMTILGYYLAEGNSFLVDKKYKSVAFHFHMDEKELHDELRDAFQKEYGYKGSINFYEDKHTALLQIYSDDLHDLCVEHCGKGKAAKQLSPQIMNLSDSKLQLLVDAYFKGDGNVCYRHAETKTSKMIRVGTVSRNLIFQIQEILGRRNIYGTICKRKGGPGVIMGRNIVRKDLYTLSYTPNAKFQMVRSDDDYFYVPVREVSSEKFSGPVFNLECDDAHTYLAKGFVVHNCSASSYSAQDSIHAAVVELFALPGAEINYFTAQNWDVNNVWNMVTKRAIAYEDSTVRWIQGELGSKTNMKYPSAYLMGERAHAEILSVAFAGKGQNQDTGGKVIHAAPNTTSQIISKSISSEGGTASYRGLLEVAKNADNCKSRVVCDALILDDKSVSNTWPTIKIGSPTADIGHEATVSKVGDEQLFYLMSRGISEAEANALIINGFIEPIIKEMPMEYAVEINRMIMMQMEGSIG